MSKTGRSTEPVTLSRDCPATTVPQGVPVILPKGEVVLVQQTLGGSITVVRELGGLVRIDEAHADALGIDTTERKVAIAGRSQPFHMDRVFEQLDTVYDPEIPISILELGLVYRCEEVVRDDGTRLIEIDMSMTAPGCGMGDVLREDAARVVRTVSGVDDVLVELVWEPPWTMERMSEEAKLQLGMF